MPSRYTSVSRVLCLFSSLKRSIGTHMFALDLQRRGGTLGAWARETERAVGRIVTNARGVYTTYSEVRTYW